MTLHAEPLALPLHPTPVALGWTRLWRALLSSPIGLAGGFIVTFWVLVALLAPLLSPYSPSANDPAALANPWPSAAHLLGTDFLGRDLLSRLIWGARTVLTVAPISTAGALVAGALMGLWAGYRRGWVDILVSRACDIILSFPVIILYLIIIVTFGASALNIVLAITVTKAPIVARIVRGVTLELREREYVAAARIRGESALYIMLVEILPNARGPLIVEACLRLGYTTITIGALGFLGVGLPPPTPDWGGMVREAYGMLQVWPHMAIFPALAISSLVIGFNMLAMAFREISLRD